MLGMPYVSPEITRLLMHDLNQPAEENSLLTDRERMCSRLIAKEFSTSKSLKNSLSVNER